MSRLVLNKEKDYDHVIIIGGGDLIIAAHILDKYPRVKKLTVCEIDDRVIDVTKEYFSFASIINEGKENGKLEIIIDDGAKYMDRLLNSGEEGKIGAIIIDCTDFDIAEEHIASKLF